MSNLQLSKYLHIIKRDNDYALYHSLFGGLCLVSPNGIAFLERFKSPESSEDLSCFNRPEVNAFLEDLRQRFFLVPEGFDEYTLVDENIRERKEHLKEGYLLKGLQLVLTNVCNFKCKYCFVDSMYNSKERSELQVKQSNKTMSPDVAKLSVEKLIDVLKRNNNNSLSIEFFGGEPLLNWPVIEEVLNTFKNGKMGETQIYYSITTNGSLINDKMAELFKKYEVTVTISFDSPKNTERVLANGENSLELIEKSLQILKAHGNYVTFNSVISEETLDHFDGISLVDFAKQYNVAMIGLILALDLDFCQNRSNRDRVIETIMQTYKYSKSQGIPIVGYWYQIFSQIIGQQALTYFSGYKTCPATGCKLSIEPEGHIFSCKCCSRYLGHISNLEEVLSSENYAEYALRAYRNAPECEGCEIEGFCAGVCMGTLENKYRNLHVIEESSCEVFKMLTKQLIMELNDEVVTLDVPPTIAMNLPQ
ncbi:radical SAM/SPASM domain-containing protein [Methanosarcina sp.]|uniref:radical SAM/SPASM domain-containing protein n=1 Tax=Methanosarcina sp. TaxID=2213 RepID=UPI002989750F|nr:radical SAM protein [Methanosarcina sp.]MDW5549429.1 radical SAM protein [Methanosarcina sp.]MDW5553380.1 radical SAM protein [Methanosarcina sp.]MDW5559704.1 radical SAM protein [Methanosarcina sp.]